MKNNLIQLNVLFFSAVLFITSCNNSQNNSAQNTADSIGAKIDTAMKDVKQAADNMVNPANQDSDFVVKATIGNKEEINMLLAGIDNGTGKEVKAHAKMMLADHKKLGDKVAAYSSGKGYTLPADDQGKANDELTKLNKRSKGTDWDKAWTDFMVNEHSDDISMFEKGQHDVKDPALKAIISDALPVLHNHYNMVKQLQSDMAVSK